MLVKKYKIKVRLISRLSINSLEESVNSFLETKDQQLIRDITYQTTGAVVDGCKKYCKSVMISYLEEV